ncbi:MAG: murein hydrolase activator EnvC [Chloroflexota bacterium]
MARRGLQAYAVPSAQAGQKSVPSARRDALSGLMTGGFLMAVIAAVLTIVIAAPEYAEPAVGAAPPSASAEPLPIAAITVEPADAPTSKLPNRLKGYRWPVRGGIVATYYDWDQQGLFSIEGRRVRGGIDITWFPGAKIKAAHRGTVVAVGQDWIDQTGFEGSTRSLYSKSKKDDKGKRGKKVGKGRKSSFPAGVVIDDGNGYYSVYVNLKNFTVKKGDKVKAGSIIGEMGTSGGRHFLRYQLVRMDGDWMRVATAARKAGYPDYARERVDPLAVLNVDANKKPRLDKKLAPADPPRLSDY